MEIFISKNNIFGKPIIALLAGSRKQEISACLPRMLSAANQFKDYQPVISGAPGIDIEFYRTILKNENVQVVFNQTYELLYQAKAAIVNSGTATLETALIGTPQVVVYHQVLGRVAYWMKDIVIKVKYISLVNLIAGKEVVKELIAHLFTEKNMIEELELILNDKIYREKMIVGYSEINKKLGEPGAAVRAAGGIIRFLSK